VELQILDPETGDLVPGALRILDACAEEGIDGVAGEFLLSMFEVKTGVCRDLTEVKNSLTGLLRRVHCIARSLGYDLAVGGTHPFTRPSAGAIFPNERYRRIQKEQGWLASQEAIFGLHVHVGVPDGDRAMGVVNLLVPYLPHLLALAANSPFWQGVDTGFASVRTRMFHPSAHSGIPQHFASWADFGRYCSVLSESGVLESTKDLYWDILPRPQLGTVEFRIFDAPASLSHLLGLTALTRYLVVDTLRLLEARPELLVGDPCAFWLARENRWLASRYGLQAECARMPGLAPTSLMEDTSGLLERLTPRARASGEDRFLDCFRPMELFETGAARLRRLYRQSGDWRNVLDDMRRWFREVTAPDVPVFVEYAPPLAPSRSAPTRPTPPRLWPQEPRLPSPTVAGPARWSQPG
jgi:carboxylate-amine ligase